eukprot:6362473-Amphidinium_carterae.1
MPKRGISKGTAASIANHHSTRAAYKRMQDVAMHFKCSEFCKGVERGWENATRRSLILRESTDIENATTQTQHQAQIASNLTQICKALFPNSSRILEAADNNIPLIQ